ncbi:MAG: zinc ribbon domain-containing protein [Ktedonobacteraceae bacterium]
MQVSPKYPVWYNCAILLVLSTTTFICAFSLTQPVQAAVFAIPQTTSLPTLTWDASMIYPDQNGNLPWGPVGEAATVHGSGFALTMKLLLVLVPGDSNKNATLCSQTGVTVASTAVSSTGKFSVSFLWPAAAGRIGQQYSICSQNASHVAISAHDSGPFTVLAGAPVLHISASSVAAGNVVTVTGQNWVPPQSITVIIGNCGKCIGSPSNTFLTNTITSNGINVGTFSLGLQIPANFPLNTYAVEAYSGMNTTINVALLDAQNTMPRGLPHLTIGIPSIVPVVSATATPTALPTVAATGTATQTATAGVLHNGTHSAPLNPDSQDSNHFPLALILGLLLPLVATIIGLLVYMVKQRQKPGASTFGRVQPSQAGYFNQQSAPYQMAYGFQQSLCQFAHNSIQIFPEPTQPLNYPTDEPTLPQHFSGSLLQPAWSQDYPNDIQQPTAPRVDPAALTVQDLRVSYGSNCFKCGTPLSADAQFCGMCGTHNDEFFA